MYPSKLYREFPSLQKNPHPSVDVSFHDIASFWASEGKTLEVKDSTFTLRPDLPALLYVSAGPGDYAFYYDGVFTINDHYRMPSRYHIRIGDLYDSADKIDRIGDKVVVTLFSEENKSYHLTFYDHRVENDFSGRVYITPNDVLSFSFKTEGDRDYIVLRLPKSFTCDDAKQAAGVIKRMTGSGLVSCSTDDHTTVVMEDFDLRLLSDFVYSLPKDKLKRVISDRIKQEYHLDRVTVDKVDMSATGNIYATVSGSGTHPLSESTVRSLLRTAGEG